MFDRESVCGCVSDVIYVCFFWGGARVHAMHMIFGLF